MTATETMDKKHQADLQQLRGFRLLDDDLLTKCFAGKPECKEGIAVMCKAMEDMRKESLQEGRKENTKDTALRMLADGTLSLEKIAEYSSLSVEEVKN